MKPFSLLLISLLITLPAVAVATTPEPVTLNLNTKNSLIRIGVAPLKITKKGTAAAKIALEAIKTHDHAKAKEAINEYEALVPIENTGGDYLGLEWLLRGMIADPPELARQLDTDTAKEYWHYFSENDYAYLKEYLERKYNLKDFSTEDPKKHMERRSFLEDQIMFNNPWRSKWENSDKLLKNMPISQGDKILDIGAGFGFYSYQFSKMVGEKGKVYAIDIAEPYIEYLKNFNTRYGYSNVEPVLSSTTDIKVKDQADVAYMCSLYHVIYSWTSEHDRQPFILSIKRALKPGGYLVIADNAFAGGKELHNLYVYQQLVQAQLHFYGFKLEKTVEITPLRYMMIFKQEPGELKELAIQTSTDPSTEFQIKIDSTNSLIHIGSLDSYDITKPGIAAAKLALEALETKNIDIARRAIDQYNTIIPQENFGGEYTALQWFCEYIAATPQQQKKMLSDPLTAAYYEFLGKNDYDLLKSFIKYKYKLVKERPINKMDAKKKPSEEDKEIGRTRRAFVEDFILFNNPRREHWENSTKIMSLLPFKKGDKIADIGSGSGYYSYRFSKIVGKTGRVYALDIKKGHITFLKDFIKQQGITNIVPINNTPETLTVDEKVDYAYMCSLYHIIYGVSSQQERDTFILNIRKALKKGGTLIIVDNGPVKDTLLPYHGPYIRKELIIAQLAHYGFTFKEYHQIIPQRYMLTFTMTDV
jgi:ubiquinone/menaquinone biosynthesis C-methylase UbiE